MPRVLPLSALLLIAGCVSAPPPPPPVRRASPPPAAVLPAPVPAPLASDWRDWPQTPGDWRYGPARGGTAAFFGPVASPTLVLRCDRDTRRVALTVPASASDGVTVRTTSQTRVLRADAARTVALPASDPLLDAIAFSRGRFVVEQPGAPPLVLPAWAEIGRVIEDCRA